MVKSLKKIWAGDPNYKKLEEEIKEAISLKQRILEKLGSYPRIVLFVHFSNPHMATNLSIINKYLGAYVFSMDITYAD